MRKFIQEHPSEKKLALVKFRITPGNEHDDIEFLDDGKEIRFNDVMYDIVSMEVSNGEQVFSCIADKDETRLLSQIKEQLLKNTTSFPFSKQAVSLVFSIFSQHYLQAKPPGLLMSPEEIVPGKFFYSEMSSVFYPQKSSPPPKRMV